MSEADQLERFSIAAESENATKTSVRARDFEFVVDEPEQLGGTDAGPNPVEYLIGSWAGCLNVVAHVVAEEFDFELRGVDIAIEGELDPRKFLGVDDEPRAGYQHLDVTVTADTDADESVLEEWLAEVEARCPVADNIQNTTPTDVSVVRA